MKAIQRFFRTVFESFYPMFSLFRSPPASGSTHHLVRDATPRSDDIEAQLQSVFFEGKDTDFAHEGMDTDAEQIAIQASSLDKETGVVRFNTGDEEHLAIVFTSDMVFTLNQIFRQKAKSRLVKQKLTDARINMDEITVQTEKKRAQLSQSPSGRDDMSATLKRTEQVGSYGLEAQRVIQRLQEIETAEELTLSFMRDNHETLLMKIFSAARLLDAKDAEASEIDCLVFPDFIVDVSDAMNDVQTEQELHKKSAEPQQLLGRDDDCEAALVKLENVKYDLDGWQQAFDNREGYYHTQLQICRQEVADGLILMVQSDFDRVHIQNVAKWTEGLKSAKRVYHEALEQAKQLGLVADFSSLSSNLVDDSGYGYRDSQEISLITEARQEWIEDWVQGAIHGMDIGPPRSADDWDVRSIDFGESLSTCADLRAEGRW